MVLSNIVLHRNKTKCVNRIPNVNYIHTITANEKPRHIAGIFKMTRICRQYVGNLLIQPRSWLIQLKRHSNEYATNISWTATNTSLGVASVAHNMSKPDYYSQHIQFTLHIHREAPFNFFSSLLGFCAAWSFASGKRSFDRIYDYQVRMWHQKRCSGKTTKSLDVTRGWILHQRTTISYCLNILKKLQWLSWKVKRRSS